LAISLKKAHPIGIKKKSQWCWHWMMPKGKIRLVEIELSWILLLSFFLGVCFALLTCVNN
jgi:hypothetical protein